MRGCARAAGRRLAWFVRPHVTPDRTQMQRALKDVLVPRIRAMGFVGEFPHFRHRIGAEYQMLMIGFNKYGGSFYLEAGRLSESHLLELQQHWTKAGKNLADSDLTVGHCSWKERARFGGDHVHPDADHWFKFGPDRLEPETYREQPMSHYRAIASQVLSSLDRQASEFFNHAA